MKTYSRKMNDVVEDLKGDENEEQMCVLMYMDMCFCIFSISQRRRVSQVKLWRPEGIMRP